MLTETYKINCSNSKQRKVIRKIMKTFFIFGEKQRGKKYD